MSSPVSGCVPQRLGLLALILFSLLAAVAADSDSDNECNTALLKNAVLTATSNIEGREPENAKLNGINAWSAYEISFDQMLIVDLGSVMNITRISTQGRAHSPEYVSKFSVSYGYTGSDYVYYKKPAGNIKMFRGNSDGDTIETNEFDVPIIARWIRIHPYRWRNRISLRLELYGCEYNTD